MDNLNISEIKIVSKNGKHSTCQKFIARDGEIVVHITSWDIKKPVRFFKVDVHECDQLGNLLEAVKEPEAIPSTNTITPGKPGEFNEALPLGDAGKTDVVTDPPGDEKKVKASGKANAGSNKEDKIR